MLNELVLITRNTQARLNRDGSVDVYDFPHRVWLGKANTKGEVVATSHLNVLTHATRIRTAWHILTRKTP